jgi:type II secretory pathway pseudopilin PulG
MRFRQSDGFARQVKAWTATKRVRAGVTLLEVLFSMGIVTVGLLGVMIIVPLAGSRSAQGMIADGADRVGRNAIRAFDVYQMRRPDSWAQYDTSNNNYQAFWGNEAFCLDPLYMAANTGTAGIFRFPYLGTATSQNTPTDIPWMKRISLRRRPGATLTNPPPTPPTPILVPAMTVEQAGQIFLGEDDLVFNLPADRTLAPEQKYDSSTSKRQWEGKFSWLATMVPKQDSDNDLYLLSIVVFHRRESYAKAERTVDVTSFDSNGFNGGDVTLSALLSSTTPATADDLKMKQGEWLLLAGMNASGVEHFRWYRIQSADSGPVLNGAGTGYERVLTLFGQDWPVALSVHKAVWIPGVVAVYEKTIRLETSSLWTGL